MDGASAPDGASSHQAAAAAPSNSTRITGTHSHDFWAGLGAAAWALPILATSSTDTTAVSSCGARMFMATVAVSAGSGGGWAAGPCDAMRARAESEVSRTGSGPGRRDGGALPGRGR